MTEIEIDEIGIRAGDVEVDRVRDGQVNERRQRMELKRWHEKCHVVQRERRRGRGRREVTHVRRESAVVENQGLGLKLRERMVAFDGRVEQAQGEQCQRASIGLTGGDVRLQPVERQTRVVQRGAEFFHLEEIVEDFLIEMIQLELKIIGRLPVRLSMLIDALMTSFGFDFVQAQAKQRFVMILRGILRAG